ncbi:hypothetical protein DL767_001747 [Monosporascus sp. MG133]|nr:hypothetical protein DL767_001747 [Monosporascus sp. MG133]
MAALPPNPRDTRTRRPDTPTPVAENLDNIRDLGNISTNTSEKATEQVRSNDTSADPDTCRICRGEGTSDEPLFYPCKCSGSIKYVHQDCLMEWLSHSQKKHCELCKTPFRFTKLYSPDMPHRLPFLVFFSHMTKYLFRNLLVWLRAFLVASVWLGWLPYLMRSVWSFLFWLSEESFGPVPSSPFNARDLNSMRVGDAISLSVTGTTTCPSTPLLAATTTAASLGGVMDQIPMVNLLKAITKPLNVTPAQSWLASLLGISMATPVLTDRSAQETLDSLNLTNVDKVTVSAVPNPYASLLSDVSALNSITRHPTVNRTIIAVLEGQLITVLVIVVFILIILVRDYVVQQQPEINMRAAFAAEADRQNVDPPAGPEDPDLRGPDSGDEEDDDSSDDELARERDEAEPDVRARRLDALALQDTQQRQRPIAGLRRRATRQNAHDVRRPDHAPSSSPRLTAQSDAGQSSQYDELLSGRLEDDDYVKALAGAMRDAPADGTSTVSQYLRIYREAEGDRDRIIQMIRDQGLEERLRHWVRITQSMPAHGKQSESLDNNAGDDGDPVPTENNRPLGPLHATQSSDTTGMLEEDISETSSWTVPDVEDQNEGVETPSTKGKQTAELNPTQRSESTSGQEDSCWTRGDNPSKGNELWRPGFAREHGARDVVAPKSRRRSISDVPQRNHALNPLANNNWSFSNLPPTPHDQVGGSLQSDQATPDSNPVADSYASVTPTAASLSQLPLSTGAFQNARIEDVASNALMRQIDGESTVPETSSGVGHGGSVEDIGSFEPVNLDDIDNASTEVRVDPPLAAAHANPPARQPAGGIVNRVADFMWGDVNTDQLDEPESDEEAVDIFGDNRDAPFMDGGGEGDDEEADDAELGPDIVEAAVAAGLDPEAIEDAEDFEGVMELIGMRGPLAGLFQNAIFCAFLVSFSIFLGIFLPYNIGRVTIWVIANPSRLVRIAFSFFKFAQDVVLLAIGYASTFVLNLLEVFRQLLGLDQGRHVLNTARAEAAHIVSGALNRIKDGFMSEVPLISANEMRNFSAVSHEALVFVKADISYLFSSFAGVFTYLFSGDYASKLLTARAFMADAWPPVWESLKAVPTALAHPGSWMVNVDVPEPSSAVNPGLAYWNAKDRIWAVLAGYVSLFITASLYLGRGRPFSTTPTAQEWEASVIDALNQASGVMKVILIISIEMLVFPLYCGLLLDFALLPLFENADFKSRLYFTYNFPLTSIFVHWFVGTGYMFHFALFVSMCRKIMRRGVLYFIRDPDDPEFHPVRDVLERNVTTQLRKIMFSGVIYGALVVVCLGGVVWGLSLALPNVLPIHYSSNEPVLEFPIDLLFYNFLMPLAVKFFRPSDALHAMYTWWFRKCARALRLTWFLFGERRVDEEGRLMLAPDSEFNEVPRWRRFFLEINEEGDVVPMTWRHPFEGGKARPAAHIPNDEMIALNIKKMKLVDSGQLIEDGRFVRSPASDQVKIPKGQPVFLTVTEQDVRLDGRDDGDVYASDKYQFVYVPPLFPLRVSLFITSIWLFAAATGVGFAIVPLVFGRRVFKLLIPEYIRTNDIYAFSIGIYILGSLAYFLFHLRSILAKVRERISSTAASMLDQHAIQQAKLLIGQAIRLAYTYTFLIVVFPVLATLMMELYILIPLHTYMYPSPSFIPSSSSSPEVYASTRLDGLREGHTIRVIQSWTLGILYLKLGTRVLVQRGGRPAQAVRAVLRGGWANPDIGVLTRAFVVPGLAASSVLILMPPLMARMALHHGLLGTFGGISHDDQQHVRDASVLLFRMAYPIAALFLLALLATRRVMRIFDGWKVRIRDEAYLIGERLHNFGGAVNGKGAGGWRSSRRVA